jgi:hypothetical protein
VALGAIKIADNVERAFHRCNISAKEMTFYVNGAGDNVFVLKKPKEQ